MVEHDDRGGSGRLQALLASVGPYLRARVRLLSFDLRRVSQQAGSAMVQAGIALISALAAAQLALVWIIAAVWNTPWRLQVIGAMTLLALFTAVLCARNSLRRQRRAAQLFLEVWERVDLDDLPPAPVSTQPGSPINPP
jgi:uncharacterized membrane protein YqjE